MKLIMAGVVGCGIGLASCGGGNSVNPQQLAGTWKGESSMTAEPDLDSTPTLTFGRAADTRGGKIEIAADFTFTKEVDPGSSKKPVTATINGKATASGTWVIEEGDDVSLILNPAETKVDVDTASLTMAYANQAKDTKDSLCIIRQMVATDVAETVIPMMTAKIQDLTRFTDVSVADNIMTLEIDQKMITFTKQ